MCDKKQKTTQSSTSTTDLTDWSKAEMAAGKSNIRGVVNDYTSKPYVPFSGPMVADLSQDEQTARDMTRNMQPREAVNYRTFADFDPTTYYNPFEDEVVSATGQYFDEDLAGKISANQARATMAGSYGGSRHGVADAELNRTSLMDKTKMMADLRYKGYEDAASRFERESGSIYNKDVRNSDAAHSDTLQTIDMLSKMGAGEREIEQAKMLAEKAKYDEAAAEEWRRFQTKLQTEIGLFGSTPMLTTNKSSGTSTSKTSDPLGNIASIAGGVGGLFGGIGSIMPPGG